jgi:general secretion pathway protein A
LLFELRHHVEERHNAGQLTAILIDEAQSLPYELLEEIRLLSNIENSTTKFLTVVLAGQPELAERLNEARLRQLKQRIALRCQLDVLNLSEVAAYVAGRLRIAGGIPVEIFTRNAIEAIHEGSSGVPRLINVICENALIGGFATQIKPVSRAMVEEVLRDFDLAKKDDDKTDGKAAQQVEDRIAPMEGEGPPKPPDADDSAASRAPHHPAASSFGVFGRGRGSSFF